MTKQSFIVKFCLLKNIPKLQMSYPTYNKYSHSQNLHFDLLFFTIIAYQLSAKADRVVNKQQKRQLSDPPGFLSSLFQTQK